MYKVAVKIAKAAHRGQFRQPPDGRPYFKHVEDVARFFSDPDTRTVAVLHDVIEDTVKFKGKDAKRKVTSDSLEQAGFPKRIIDGVKAMTKHKGANYKQYLRKSVKGNKLALRVKVADNYVNLRDAIGRWTSDAKARERVHKYVDSLHFLKKGL